MPVGRSVSRRAAMCAVVVLLAIAPLAGADAAPNRTGKTLGGEQQTSPAVDARARIRAVNNGDFGIPAPPNNPMQEPYDGVGDTGARATKIKTSITLPRVRLLSYLRLCVEVIQDGTFDPENCPAIHPPKTTFDTFDNPGFPVWIRADGPLWILSPPGSKLRYGSFPAVRVRTLAFGSVPISATVRISQPVGSDGYVDPLQVNYLLTASPGPAEGGTVFANKYWPGGFTFPANGGSNYLVAGFRATGTADISVSDVEIDGRAVDVGSSCRTVKPGQIVVGSPAGSYSSQAKASDLRGRPGGAQVLNSDDSGSVQGTVAIPAFTGCRDGAASLDPLLTSFVSGPNNPLEVLFSSPFNACSRSDRAQPCPSYPAAPQQARIAAAGPAMRSALAAPQRTSMAWSRLPSAQRVRIVKKLAAMPQAQLATVLSALPTKIAAAVRAAAK